MNIHNERAAVMQIPYFRPSVTEAEVGEVTECLRSGWLTTGPRVKRFETEFAASVGADNAIALNSCTAALHLGVEAVGLRRGQAVLVPTLTFAATAEVVHYLGATPVLVDCEEDTGNLCLADAQCKLEAVRAKGQEVVGIMPVHVAGYMMDVDAVTEFASRNGLWVVEDAAHAFPAAYRPSPEHPWRRCGEGTARVTCFSFYANKTITTGEGGMAVTNDASIADRIRLLSLHGLSHDAWQRYSGSGKWDYQIVAPGYKYNLTDIAAAIGLKQLERAEHMRADREAIAVQFLSGLSEVAELALPPTSPNRIHSWHLFPIRLRQEALTISRNEFFDQLRTAGISCSVHWRPLHLHPFYRSSGWEPGDCPVATQTWEQRISLPIFSGMTSEECAYVISALKSICSDHRRAKVMAAPQW